MFGLSQGRFFAAGGRQTGHCPAALQRHDPDCRRHFFRSRPEVDGQTPEEDLKRFAQAIRDETRNPHERRGNKASD